MKVEELKLGKPPVRCAVGAAYPQGEGVRGREMNGQEQALELTVTSTVTRRLQNFKDVENLREP